MEETGVPGGNHRPTASNIQYYNKSNTYTMPRYLNISTIFLRQMKTADTKAYVLPNKSFILSIRHTLIVPRFGYHFNDCRRQALAAPPTKILVSVFGKIYKGLRSIRMRLFTSCARACQCLLKICDSEIDVKFFKISLINMAYWYLAHLQR